MGCIFTHSVHVHTCRHRCSHCHSLCCLIGWSSSSRCLVCSHVAGALVEGAERSSNRWLQTPYWLQGSLPTGPHYIFTHTDCRTGELFFNKHQIFEKDNSPKNQSFTPIQRQSNTKTEIKCHLVERKRSFTLVAQMDSKTV